MKERGGKRDQDELSRKEEKRVKKRGIVDQMVKGKRREGEGGKGGG